MHSWDLSVQDARALQLQLAPRVSTASGIGSQVSHLAGTDISPPDSEGTVRAAVVVLSYPGLEVEEVSLAEGKPGFPYIPGLLSFREIPVLVDALEGLRLAPDIIIADGQGLAHPRRFGLACHIGLLTDTPTIGCAKSRLIGSHAPVGREAGSRAELMDRGEVVGVALRTRADVRPVYVSVGHKVDLASTSHWVLAASTWRRLPETTRLAHRAAAGLLDPDTRGGVGTRQADAGVTSGGTQQARLL